MALPTCCTTRRNSASKHRFLRTTASTCCVRGSSRRPGSQPIHATAPKPLLAHNFHRRTSERLHMAKRGFQGPAVVGANLPLLPLMLAAFVAGAPPSGPPDLGDVVCLLHRHSRHSRCPSCSARACLRAVTCPGIAAVATPVHRQRIDSPRPAMAFAPDPECIVVAEFRDDPRAFAGSRSAEAHDASIRSAAQCFRRMFMVVWGAEFPFRSLASAPLQPRRCLAAERVRIFGVHPPHYSRNAIGRAKGPAGSFCRVAAGSGRRSHRHQAAARHSNT